MTNVKLLRILLINLAAVSANAVATSKIIQNTERMLYQHVAHPFYAGGSLGYGNTDWSEITTPPSPLPPQPNNPAALSAPIGADSGGFAYGGFMGYQFSEHFLLEADYVHYSRTKVDFQSNIYGNNYNLENLKTDTNAYSILGKILVPFGFTKVYVYADAGATIVQRKDISIKVIPGNDANFRKKDTVHLGPSFGFGLAYNITKRIFSEASFQYTTGYGKADMTPAEDYIPFVYDIMFNLGVRFGDSKPSGDNPELDASSSQPIKNSLYLGLGMGYGASLVSSSDKSAANNNSIAISSDSGFTVGSRVGYLFNPYVALQAEYYYLPGIQLKASGSLTETSSSNLVAPELKVIYPATHQLGFFAKGGYAVIYSSNQASINDYTYIPQRLNYEPIVGAGLEYRFYNRLSFIGQYTAVIDANNKYPTTNLVSAGFNYYF